MSNSDNSGSKSGGIGFVGLLTIVFITLKLLDKITWSWWWVLSPLWITAAFAAFVLIMFALAALAATRGGKRNGRVSR